MSYSTNLPPINLIPLEGKKQLSLPTSDFIPPTSSDIRWLKVQEFFRSVSLAPHESERAFRRYVVRAKLAAAIAAFDKIHEQGRLTHQPNHEL